MIRTSRYPFGWDCIQLHITVTRTAQTKGIVLGMLKSKHELSRDTIHAHRPDAYLRHAGKTPPGLVKMPVVCSAAPVSTLTSISIYTASPKARQIPHISSAFP